MRGFGEGKRAEKRGAEAGVLLPSNTPCNTRATPFPHSPHNSSAAPSSDCRLPLVSRSGLPPCPTMVSLDFPSIHSIEDPAPPDTLTLPPPSPVDDFSHPRPEEPLPSAIEAAADASASGSGPASGKPPSPFPIALPPPALAPMAAATTKATTVRVRANSRSHPKTPPAEACQDRRRLPVPSHLLC